MAKGWEEVKEGKEIEEVKDNPYLLRCALCALSFVSSVFALVFVHLA
jgi:hypothetical protein